MIFLDHFNVVLLLLVLACSIGTSIIVEPAVDGSCISTVNDANASKWAENAYHQVVTKDDKDKEDASVDVDIEMHVQDVSALDELTSDFEIDILFSQVWKDKKLEKSDWIYCKNNITLKLAFLDKIWSPNTCLVNSKSSYIHSSPTNNVFVIVYRDGKVWVNYRMKARGPCDLNLEMFPFDTQTCELQFESYSYNTDEVKLNWQESSPVVFMKQIKLPDFELTGYKIYKKTMNYPNGHWDRLTTVFKFERRRGFYMLQAYIPTYLTIVLSWVSFFMDSKALPARTTLGVSSLLALTLQFGNISKNLPRVSYIKAMDVWMLGCITFVFASMIQLAVMCLATKLNRRGLQIQRRTFTHNESNSPRIALTSFYPLSENTDASQGDDVNELHYIDDSQLPSPSILNVRSRMAPLNAGARQTDDVIRKTTLPNGTQNLNAERAKLLSTNPVISYSHRETRSNNPPKSKSKRSGPLLMWYHRISPETVDYAAIVIFPLSFMIFNIFYWCYYLALTTSHVDADGTFMHIKVEGDE